MSKGSGDEEAEGRASKLDARHVKIVWLDHRPKGLLCHKGGDDSAAGDDASAGADKQLSAAEESVVTIAMAHSPEQGGDKQREVLLLDIQ
jgi:hypothetical protein